MVLLCRNTLDGHSLRVWSISTFPDNERVVTASDDGDVIVWKFRTQEKEHYWHHDSEGATAVAVSPDGRMVVSGGRNGSLQLWDAGSGDRLPGPWKQHEQRVWSVSWSPDGRRIASCSADGTLIIWNARSRLPSGEALLGPLQTGHDNVRAITYCPNGGKVATGGHDSTIKIWNDTTGALQATLYGHTNRVSSVAWTKDGSRVISGSVDRTVRVWDYLKEQTVHEIQEHTDAINYISVSDHMFATTSADHTIYLWDLKTYQRLDG
ncbi:WD40 repeat-like protein [Rhizopogon vinicolor AM-OR11-026]|uniref:WD40 repeat-like protein n=1 Tax=Rhizopogon vinicolor AM-OR11-026 TaxID=1314800 RepID=A0A1B7MXS8_9AGAM|nr:WD40 repeat-like protein [Rhizopogon vinicolor AM-OR11-026]